MRCEGCGCRSEAGDRQLTSREEALLVQDGDSIQHQESCFIQVPERETHDARRAP